MVAPRLKTDPRNAIILRFGGGLNTRASEDEVRENEATDGQNFALDARNRELRNRKGFDLLGMVPNASEIRGGASLLKSDGTVSMLVQAADTVYEWNGASFTSVGIVSASAKLRGPLAANFTLNDEAIITDLNLSEPVLTWNGTTLSTMTENLTGDFLAKYCWVEDERAFFGNVVSNAVPTPHMLVGSERGDNTVLSVSSRPASGATGTDPFFLLTPDLRPINGLTSAFGSMVMSSQKGRIYILTGSDKTDYAIDKLYSGSAADGAESLAFVGNDVTYGRQGKIESLLATDKFGDVEAADVSIDIADRIEGYTDWTTIYNSRLDRIYFLPAGQSELWVFHKALAEASPWSKWTTQHASAFQPSFMMSMLDPVDGLEYVYFGDSTGGFYRLEGSGGDAGANIRTTFTSRLFSVPYEDQFSKLSGWIKYRKNEAVTVTMTLLYAGSQVLDEPVTIAIPAASGGNYYGGDFYYGGDNFYGLAFFDRIVRQTFGVPGKSNDFQVRLEVDGTSNFRINELGLRLEIT